MKARRWLIRGLVVGASLVVLVPMALGVRDAIVNSLTTNPQTKTLKGAYHVHSTESDGRGDFGAIARAAKTAGLDFVVVTDHNVAPRAREQVDGVWLYREAELSTPSGHLVALGTSRMVTPEERHGSAVDAVHALGGAAMLAHPVQAKSGWRDWASAAKADGLELFSADSLWQGAIRHPFSRLLPGLGAYLVDPRAGLLEWVTDPVDERERLLALGQSRSLLAMCAIDAHGLPPYAHAFGVMASFIPDASQTSLPVSAKDLMNTPGAYCAFQALADPSGFALEVEGTAPRPQRIIVHLPPGSPQNAEVRVHGAVTLESDGKTLIRTGQGIGLVEVWVPRDSWRRSRQWLPWIIARVP